jgi:hypothetical protein
MGLKVKPLQATEGFRGLCIEAYVTLERTIVAANRPVGDVSFSAPVCMKFDSRSELTDVSTRGIFQGACQRG